MDAIQEYFLEPLMRNGWFNPVNSAVYGICLIAGMWAIFTLLKKVDVKVDRGLFVSMLPFVAFAGVTRSLRDYIYFSASATEGFLSSFPAYMHAMQQSAYDYVLAATSNGMMASLDSYIIAWFPTPGSYLITASIALISFGIGLVVRRFWKVRVWKTMALCGTAAFIMNASIVPVTAALPLLYIGSVAIGWTALFFFLGTGFAMRNLSRLSKELSEMVGRFFTPLNSAILSAHLFDATATFFAIAVFTTLGGQGYTEQHFLSRWMMPYLGPQVMFLLKFAVVVPVIYFIDRYTEDEDLARFLKLAVFILGIAPATRNLVRLMVGV